MAVAFIPGFLASLVLDTVDQTIECESVGLSRAKTVLSKGSMDGTGFMKSIPGPITGTLTAAGHIVTETAFNALEATYLKDVPVAFVLTIVEGKTTDGEYSGLVTLADLAVQTTADGNWSFTLSGETSGIVTYTPAAT